MPSVKKNFIYSSILTTANYVFPLLTYPYISRVLGVDNIGAVNFVDSIVSYFILFAMMGIGVCGIREIAASTGDKLRMSRSFSSLLLLSTITTAIAVIGLAAATLLVPKLQANSSMMHMGVIKLGFTYLCIEWFYQGLEDFSYITRRTIFVKSLFVASVFLFVRDPDDYAVYYLLMCMMVAVNAVINIVHARKFVTFSFRGISFRPFVRPFLIMGVFLFLTSMYTSFNVAYLGFVTNDTQVGYYTTAVKLYSIILALFTAFTGVMMPRMCALLANKEIEKFKAYFYKSTDALMSFALPAIVFSMVMAPEIILLLSGPNYEGAITPMRIVMPLILIIGYEQVLVIQTLMPLKKDNVISRNSFIGAGVGVGLNLLLVPMLQSVGSAIVWLVCEVVVLILSQIAVSKAVHIKSPYLKFGKMLLVYIPLGFMLIFLNTFIFEGIWRLMAGGIVTLTYMVSYNMMFERDGVVIGLINKIVRR